MHTLYTHIETISTNHFDFWWLNVYCNHENLVSVSLSLDHFNNVSCCCCILLIYKHLWVLRLLLPFQFYETTNLLCHINNKMLETEQNQKRERDKKHTPNKSCSHRFENDRWNVVNELICFLEYGRLFSFILFCLWVRWVDWNTFKFLMGSLLMALKYASFETTHMHLSPFILFLFFFFPFYDFAVRILYTITSFSKPTFDFVAYI